MKVRLEFNPISLLVIPVAILGLNWYTSSTPERERARAIVTQTTRSQIMNSLEVDRGVAEHRQASARFLNPTCVGVDFLDTEAVYDLPNSTPVCSRTGETALVFNGALVDIARTTDPAPIRNFFERNLTSY